MDTRGTGNDFFAVVEGIDVAGESGCGRNPPVAICGQELQDFDLNLRQRHGGPVRFVPVIGGLQGCLLLKEYERSRARLRV